MSARCKAIIIASGRGWYLRPNTENIPKCMVPNQEWQPRAVLSPGNFDQGAIIDFG